MAVTLRPIVEPALEAAFWLAFVVEAIEAHGLTYGGGATGFVARRDGRRTTATDREAVLTWLRARDDVFAFDVGPPIGAD